MVGQNANRLTGHQAFRMHLALAAVGGHQRGGLGCRVKQAADFPFGARLRQRFQRIAQGKQKQQRATFPPRTDGCRPDRHRQHQKVNVQAETLQPVKGIHRRIPAPEQKRRRVTRMRQIVQVGNRVKVNS